ncbi:MAG TPA: hypothetical protein VFG10_09080 [Saprospiraceae bacterium]|nr:hypothetical protein [Saprospiraceae bacterium]
MKSLITVAITFLFLNLAYSQHIVPDSVRYHEGQTITVCGKIVDTFVTKSEKKITHLNFEYGYPNQTFSVTIFGSDLPKFSYVPAEFLKGKNVCVTGKVRMYNGRPEIVVNAEDQLKVE